MVIVAGIAFGKMLSLLYPGKMEHSKKWRIICQMLYSFGQNVWYTLLGLMVLLVTVIYAVILTPVYGYRWLVVKVVAPVWNPSLGKAVQVSGQYMAAEFLSKRKYLFWGPPAPQHNPQRSVIVCSAVIDGTVVASDLGHVITEGWLTIPKGEEELKYPEFQQYLEYYGGFMFWKKDPHFSLGDHLHVHKISEEQSNDPEECEKVLNDLLENLMNTPFPLRKSPWEVHLLHNYRDPTTPEGRNTVITFRFHHSMVDGFSIMYAVIQGLAGRRLLSIDVASPKNMKVPQRRRRMAGEIFRQLVYVPWRIIRDAGYLSSLERGAASRSPWYISDQKKEWKQLCGRSKLIPVETIKFIKNQLGVSFTGVLLSGLAAGAAENFKLKGFTGQGTFPIYSVVPLPNHPNKLRNHALGTILELDASSKVANPVERLRRTDKVFQDARHSSQLPLIFSLFGALMSFPMAPLSRHLCRNRVFPALLTNFPGPGTPLALMGQKLHSLEFCVGGEEGVCGVTFSLVSYSGHVRLVVTAEQAVMTRKELTQLIDTVTREIEVLYERALIVAAESSKECKFYVGEGHSKESERLEKSTHIV